MTKQYIASFEAKTNFSKILHDIKTNCSEYVVTIRGKPVAVIIPFHIRSADKLQKTIDDFISTKKSFKTTNKTKEIL